MRKWLAQTLADIKLGLWLGEACRNAVRKEHGKQL